MFYNQITLEMEALLFTFAIAIEPVSLADWRWSPLIVVFYQCMPLGYGLALGRWRSLQKGFFVRLGLLDDVIGHHVERLVPLIRPCRVVIILFLVSVPVRVREKAFSVGGRLLLRPVLLSWSSSAYLILHRCNWSIR